MRCFRSLRLVMVALMLGLAPASAARSQPTGYEGYQVVRIDIADEGDLQAVRRLQALGHDFEVWSEVVRPGPIEVRVSPAARAALKASGLTNRVIIEDLQEHLDRLFPGPGESTFFNGLRTFDEHIQFLTDLATAYPDLAEAINVGVSVEGRAIRALHITGSGHVKPGVFFHGAQHGNEAAGASVVAYVAYSLLTGYGADPEITALVDHADWWLLPIVNPDGYVAFQRYNANGVDLNRNWGGPGSGFDPWGGPYPFSEPETAALRDFLLSRPTVRVHVDVHGYVPWLMWPWGHIPDPCQHQDTFESVVQHVRDLIIASGGGVYYCSTIYQMAFGISGCSCNYAYGILKMWSFAFEVAHDWMPDICEEFLSGLLFLGDWIWNFDCNANQIPDVQDIADGTSVDCNGTGIPDECEDFCPADVDDDCTVSVSDLLRLLSEWGVASSPADINHDGIVDGLDLAELLDAWGPCT